MPKYQATFTRVETYYEHVEFEAESEEKAEEMAEEMLEEGISFDGEVADGSESVFEILEILDDAQSN